MEQPLGEGTEPADRGLYILWLRLPAAAVIRVGALGDVHFPAGLYAYVGSAQRNRLARVRRHLRPDKPRRWHIDYLRPHGDVVAVSYREGTRAGECLLAEELIAALGARRTPPRFGAGDCHCGGHLLAVPAEVSRSIATGRGWPSGTYVLEAQG